MRLLVARGARGEGAEERRFGVQRLVRVVGGDVVTVAVGAGVEVGRVFLVVKLRHKLGLSPAKKKYDKKIMLELNC